MAHKIRKGISLVKLADASCHWVTQTDIECTLRHIDNGKTGQE
jgi:hypothetical protein